MSWQIGKYVTLDKQQKKIAKAKLQRFHQWHRQTQLPRYASYLRELKAKLAHPLNGELVHKETDIVQELLDDSVAYLIPTAVEIISTLSDKQVDELLGKLEKEQKKYQKDYVDMPAEKVAKKRVRELKDSLGSFIGRLTREQKTQLNEWSQSIEPYESLALEQQKTFAKEIDLALANRKDKVALDKTLRELMFYRTDDWDSELESILDRNQALTYKFLATLLNNLNDTQKRKLNNKLDSYITDLTSLSQRNNSKH